MDSNEDWCVFLATIVNDNLFTNSIQSWNPNGAPCFGWNLGLVLGGLTSLGLQDIRDLVIGPTIHLGNSKRNRRIGSRVASDFNRLVNNRRSIRRPSWKLQIRPAVTGIMNLVANDISKTSFKSSGFRLVAND